MNKKKFYFLNIFVIYLILKNKLINDINIISCINNMFKLNSERIKVDDDASVSSISDLDVKEIERPKLQRQQAKGYMSPPHSPLFKNSENPEFPLQNQPSIPSQLQEPSISSLNVPKLRRERQSDYGMFDQYFEDDVVNWFRYISNDKRTELIHILVDMLYYNNVSNIAPYHPDSPLPNINDRLGSMHPSNTDFSINLDDVEDLSQNDSFILNVKKNKED